MDIAQFNLIRPVSSPRDGGALLLTERRVIGPHPDSGPDVETHALPPGPDDVTLTLASLPDAFGSARDDPLRADALAGNAPPLQRTYVLLHRLDTMLASKHDRVSGSELVTMVGHLLKGSRLAEMNWATGMLAKADLTAPFQIALLGLRKALVTAMNPKTRFEGAEKLARLALIADLLNRSAKRIRTLAAEETFGLLNRRPVVMEGMKPQSKAPAAKVSLIREAKVADLQVIRREWATFIPSEIANIRNLMAGESFKQTDKTTTETETTSTKESQQSTQTVQETQSKLDSELSQQISTQLGITVNGHADASATFSYPMVTASVSGGIDATLSLQRSETHASKLAREAVSRAVSQVDSMTRESRSRRELMRTEQGFEYSLENDTGANVHAVYRWVDRVDNYQVFRFPDRFLLEFQIPEPAEYYRWRTTRQESAASNVDLPPDWKLTREEITEDELIKLAVKYRASNLPAPPEAAVSLAATVTVQLGQESLPISEAIIHWNLTAAAKDLEITIPPGYLATQVYYSGEGYPVRGVWRNSFGEHREGYHAAFATVSVGKKSAIYWNGGIRKGTGSGHVFFSTHGENNDLGSVTTIQAAEVEPPYGRAFLTIGRDADLNPKPVRLDLVETGTNGMAGVPNSLKVSVSSLGVTSCSVTFMVRCERTRQAYVEWQLSVYDALYAAWAQWKKEYQNNQMRNELLGGSASDAGSSQRNDQIVREELKREVISWLLNEPNFGGRPGLQARVKTGPGTSFRDIDFKKAILDAPTIQFMEQAFEWTNMTYVFYPYFWADRKSEWDTLSAITANDPQFERFLRAGSSRVIVPARPGFEVAVHNWLLYKIPFLSGQLPALDDPLYVSIDKEIRDLTSPWEGGVAGDSWQSRVSTTMLYLETEGDLPFTNSQAQLPATLGETFKPKIY